MMRLIQCEGALHLLDCICQTGEITCTIHFPRWFTWQPWGLGVGVQKLSQCAMSQMEGRKV